MLLKSKQICDELNIHRITLYRWINQNPDFPTYRVGRDWRFDLDEVYQWIDKQKASTINHNTNPDG